MLLLLNGHLMIKWFFQLVESKKALFNGMLLKLKITAIRSINNPKNPKRKKNKNRNMNSETKKENKQSKVLNLNKKVEMKP